MQGVISKAMPRISHGPGLIETLLEEQAHERAASGESRIVQRGSAIAINGVDACTTFYEQRRRCQESSASRNV